jgi:hypothetical protein
MIPSGFSGGSTGLWSLTVRLSGRKCGSWGEPYGDCLTHAAGHYERWQQWQALGPVRLACKGFPAQIAWTEYDDWPRGRVGHKPLSERF